MGQVRLGRGGSPQRSSLQVGQPQAQTKDRTVASRLSSRPGIRNPCKTEAGAANTTGHAVTSGTSVTSVTATRHFPSTLVGQVLLEYGMPAQQDSSDILAPPMRTSPQARQASPSAVPTAEGRLPSNGCTCSRRPLAVGGGGKRTTKPLPFHMMPYEVQAHLLQHRGMSQSGDAASWYPLRPPTLAAVAASTRAVGEQGTASNYGSEATRHIPTSINGIREDQGNVHGRHIEDGKVLLATSLPEQALLSSCGLLQEIFHSEARECDCVAGERSTGRPLEPPLKSTDIEKSSVDTAATSLACSPASAEAGARLDVDDQGGLVLKALGVVIKSCFVRATELHEVCLTLSNICREEMPWSLLVDEATSPQLVDHIWPGTMVAALGHHLPRMRLVPRCNISRVRLVDDRVVIFASWPAMMKRLKLGGRFNHPVEGVFWPPGLEYLAFGPRFNQPVARVTWPPALKELVFGNDFNQPFSGVDLPAGLRRLDFGGRFNRGIAAVNWSEAMEELRLGHGFNRGIAAVSWPKGLLKLEIDGEFPQRIEDVSWPQALQHLGLLGNFNQPIRGVKWPQSLKTVVFGNAFNKSLTSVHWPPGLEIVVLGCEFYRKLGGVAWPPSLRKLTVPLEDLLGTDRSNLPSACVIESIYKSGCTRAGGLGECQLSDAEQDEADDSSLSEDGYGDSTLDVFGYENEPWDMGDEGWNVSAAWEKLNLGEAALH